MTQPSKVLFVFLDGVGIGTADPDVNPFARASVPTLHELVGGTLPTLQASHVAGTNGRAFPLDATLGVPGTPQSGTGQASLLTGVNAVALHGSHFGPWTPVGLRPLVEEQSILRRAKDAGRSIAFANAYPRGWPGPRGSRRVAGPPLAARGAGVLDRHEEALGDGRAVASEITNDGWRRHLGHTSLPSVTPEGAGRNLAGIVRESDLTLYAHYTTDTVGHRGCLADAVAALERVDHFLGATVEALPDSTLLIIASDHGNIEDARGGHTLNPALGVLWGAGALSYEPPVDLPAVADLILEILGVGGGA